MRALPFLLASALAVLPVACGARTDLDGSGGAATTTSSGTGGVPCSPGECFPTCDVLTPPDCFGCEGEPIPAVCPDGLGWSCPPISCPEPSVIWAKTADGAGFQGGRVIAVGPDGSIIVAGMFGGTIDLGGDLLVSAEPGEIHEVDVFVVKLLPDGTHVWSRAFGAWGDDFVTDVAVDAAGNIVLVGDYRNALSFDGFALPDGSPASLFVAKLDPDGQVLFAKGFVGGSNGTHGRVEVAPDGDIVIAGDTSGTIDFGGGPLPGPNHPDTFVVRLDPSGDHVWSRRFSGESAAIGTDLALAPGGDVIVTGTFQKTLDFGLGALVSAGDTDVFLLRLDAAGNVMNGAAYGGPGAERANSVVVDGAGNVVLTASHSDGADFGTGKLSTAALGGVIASYTPDGTPRYALPFSGPAELVFTGDIFRLAVDAQNDVVLAGPFAGTFQLGAKSFASSGDYDLVVAKIDANGSPKWAYRWGTELAEILFGVATDPATSDILITGAYWAGFLDFGLGLMMGDGEGDMFVARLPPTGSK